MNKSMMEVEVSPVVQEDASSQPSVEITPPQAVEEADEKMVDDLKNSNNKKSAKISKLKEDIIHLIHEILEQNDRIKYLSERLRSGRGMMPKSELDRIA
ncbi:uncharacterized protein A4U43_C04F23280 [Asparagus officinalis]|uniref:Uncharacterized protein n=1 Tax=Asparagus officinalis TaxID=4686 RepID=A0A5P1F811_ASPOF|nr:uncharacterized protein A4U43_C04F23280 [Asparagus officinalis]